MILVFANQKGGVGKTTMCMAFANYLSKRGVNTLVVDVDRQRNFLFQRKADMEAFTGQEGDYNVEAADVETREEAAELMETIIELDGVVLIDSPGNVTEDGLIPVFAHADYIICPFKYEKKCLESTGNFISVINKLKHQIEGMKASLIFVPNIIDKRIGVTEELEFLVLADRRKGKAGRFLIAQSVEVAFRPINEMFELELRRYGFPTEHGLQVAVQIRLGELLGKLADMEYRLVQRVTVLSYGTHCISADLQLVRKERYARLKGWNLCNPLG